MKILGVLGSPRKNGNSDLLLDEALKGARSKGAQVEKICLYDLNFKACIACNGCDNTGECVLKDDMTPLYDKLRAADGIIIAAPIYFAGIPAQLKAMIDRCQSEWVAKYVLKSGRQSGDRSGPVTIFPSDLSPRRSGAFMSVSGFKRNIFFEAAKKPIEAFFKTMNIDFSDELFFAGVENKGDIKNIKGALEKACNLGVEIAKGDL